jgi:glutamate carboxypeptidase
MLHAALDGKVKDKLVPDTETPNTIEVGRPPFVANRGRLLAMEGKLFSELGRTLEIQEMTGGHDAGYANRSGKAVVVESFGLAVRLSPPATNTSMPASIVPRLYLMTRMLTELGKRK